MPSPSGSAAAPELIEARAARLARTLEPLGVPLEEEAAHWEDARRFGWVDKGARLVVIPTVPHRIVALGRRPRAPRRRPPLRARRQRRLGRLAGGRPARGPFRPARRPGDERGRPHRRAAPGTVDWRRRSRCLCPPRRGCPRSGRRLRGADTMRHEIAVESLGVRGPLMTDPIGACVHCGFCLPTCPTYVTMGEEMDSPRGRIFLMKEVLEGKMEGRAGPALPRQLPRLPGLRDGLPLGGEVRRPDHRVPLQDRAGALAAAVAASAPRAGAGDASAPPPLSAPPLASAPSASAYGCWSPARCGRWSISYPGSCRRRVLCRRCSAPRDRAGPASLCSAAACSRSSTRRSAGRR